MTQNPVLAVLARGLTKKYGDLTVVKGINFEVRRGECYGFLGPNGAGKTSTMKMVYGRSTVTGGELKVLGLDAQTETAEIKRRVGVVPQENNLDPDLNVMENLVIYARYYGQSRGEAAERARRALEFVQLMDKSGARIEELSGGMKRRLVIARALLNDPELLVLDEPTTGLDPRARHAVWQQLAELKSRGVTLILTTHYMEEASRLCDRLVMMDSGLILAEGTPEGLIRERVGIYVLEVPATAFEESPDGARALKEILPFLRGQMKIGSSLFLFSDANGPVTERLSRRRPDLKHLVFRPANLEDVFLTLADRGLDE